MKQLAVATTVLSLLALNVAAQEMPVVRRTSVPFNVMGKSVEHAPYSADEITESLQVLADGTRISNQSQVAVYRDGEGRVRRESPKQITIWDPVENVSYTLDPKRMTAVKTSMGRSTYSFQASDYVIISNAAGAQLPPARKQVTSEAQVVAASLDKLKAELASGMIVNGNPANPQETAAWKEQLDAAMVKASKTAAATPGKSESLGQRVMQGVTADGTRTTETIEAGTIGNDRPIQLVSERWYSSELQTAVFTRRTDPRNGEETFRLENIRRGEPGADLFLLPPGYQLQPDAFKVVVPYVKKEE